MASIFRITYTQLNSGKICGSATISASSCRNELCTHKLKVTSSLCPHSAGITVSVSESNLSGIGPSTIAYVHAGMYDTCLIAQLKRNMTSIISFLK